jgi:hypothetical protein
VAAPVRSASAAILGLRHLAKDRQQPAIYRRRRLDCVCRRRSPDCRARVATEASLRRTIRSYLAYYHGSRTHLSLAKDTPEGRTIQPPALGRVVAIPHLGGLHHRFERRARRAA